jgi:hypothetical protein
MMRTDGASLNQLLHPSLVGRPDRHPFFERPLGCVVRTVGYEVLHCGRGHDDDGQTQEKSELEMDDRTWVCAGRAIRYLTLNFI